MMIWVDIHIFSSSVRLHLHSSNQYIEVVEKRKISLAWTGSQLMSEPAKSLRKRAASSSARNGPG